MGTGCGVAAVHLVFGDSLAGSLKLAIDQMGYKDTHKVVTFRDRFAIGPLWRLQEEAGRAERARWFRDHINEDREEMDYEYVAEADDRRLAGQLARIPAGASIILWTGDNAHEQAGLRYAAYLLRHSRNEMFVIDAGKACAARFNTADRTIEYMHSGEVSPEKLKAIFGENRKGGPLPHETKASLEREWLSLAEQHEVLRVWDGERIRNVDERYFDTYVLDTVEKIHRERANHEFIKAARVIGDAMGHCGQYVPDGYFEYRLRELVYSGQLEIHGVPKAMRYYSVRRRWRQDEGD
ncbi:DUF1835 domain-containing protein [Paenibacillus sp. P25]|nr:DUF1835 domain-containing protein [Paenibacillus sp. P25]